jgi:hypothetical protein
MVCGLAALTRSREDDVEMLFQLSLTDELVEKSGPQTGFI